MKHLKATGNHSRKSAEVISEAIEDKLWESKVLGDNDGQSLLVSVFYYVGLCFALRGGEEHRRRRHTPSQINLFEPSDGRSYLVYEEDTSKTNQGGLLHGDRAPKRLFVMKIRIVLKDV